MKKNKIFILILILLFILSYNVYAVITIPVGSTNFNFANSNGDLNIVHSRAEKGTINYIDATYVGGPYTIKVFNFYSSGGQDSWSITLPYHSTYSTEVFKIQTRSDFVGFGLYQWSPILLRAFNVNDGNYPTLPALPANPVEPFNLLSSKYNSTSNDAIYEFSKNILINKEDIKILDNDNNSIDFTYEVIGKKLTIIPTLEKQGTYKIKLLSVFDEDNQNLNNISDLVFDYKDNIKILSRNFQKFISHDLENLILIFDRDIQSADLILLDKDSNTILETDIIITGKKLIIDYDFFKEDTNYLLQISQVLANDSTKINNIEFEFRSLKTTGNSGIDTILAEFLNIFIEAKNTGIKIVILAIGIGIIFIISIWLWNKSKRWLKKI